MRSPIFDFFLLVLGVTFNLTSDVIHKRSGFSKVLSEKSLEFILSGESGPITFDSGLMLLPTEVDFLLEK